MDFLLLGYIVAGPAAWLLIALGIVTARVRMLKLRNNRRPLPENPPGVTVLIPAHNEGNGIKTCLETVLALDYPSLKVIAIDDRSTDQTAQVMLEVATKDPRLTVIQVTHKPTDWLGKCHALHVGSKQVTTPWILFVDSDVTVTTDALRKVMAHAIARQSDAVSILTRQRCETFWERLLTPFACAAILAMYVASATNDDSRKRTAFANGQFFLIRREIYEKVGGHESVKNLPTEDVDLMRVLKRNGGKCRLYAGDDLAETRMYDSLHRMFKGWARIYSGASHRRPWRILIGMSFVLSGLLAFVMLPMTFAYPFGTQWWVAAACHLVVVVSCLAAIYRWSGNAAYHAILFPLTAVMQLAFYSYALWWCITNRMEWRGTSYSTSSAT